MEFVAIPKEVTVNQELGKKRVLVFISAVSTMSPNMETLIRFAGLSYDRHRNGIVDCFSSCVESFISDELFKVKNDKLYQVLPVQSFGTVSKKEIDEIIAARKRKGFNHVTMFLILAYIRASMMRNQGLTYYSNLSTRMCNDIGITRQTLSNQIDSLEQLQILHSERLPRYKDKEGNWHTDVMVFVDMKESWQDDAEKAKYQILCHTNGEK